jgi:cation diffusion facilitator family transporter
MDNHNQNIRKRISKQEGWLSIVVNILLFGLKYWAGIVSGSLALVADAWHTLSDSISSVFVLVSAGISNKKPDKEHPFGHGRYELVATIFIGVLLILIGFNFIKEGAERFIEKESANYGWIAIVVTLFSILMKEGLAQFAFWGYSKTNSATLKADGWHHRSDALSSVVILIGIFVGRFIWWIDAFLSVVVALFLFYTAFELIKNSISVILGERAEPKLIKKIQKLSNELSGRDLKIHHVHVHNYVIHTEMTFHICLPSDYTIEQAHQITNLIEKKIKEAFHIEATIHVDPL